MRHFILLAIFFAGPAAAWEFTPGLPCYLRHADGAVEVELTHDPTQPLYTITIRQPEAWPRAAIFAMRFEGDNALMISTDRHVISPDGKSVTVTDRGFGNVLNGLQFNATVTALLGEAEVRFSLDGAVEPVADFRICRAEPGV